MSWMFWSRRGGGGIPRGNSVHAVPISTTLPIIKVSHEIFIHTPPSFIDGNILYRLLNRTPKRAEKHTLRSAEPRVAPPPRKTRLRMAGQPGALKYLEK
jgi:hypothetical protein